MARREGAAVDDDDGELETGHAESGSQDADADGEEDEGLGDEQEGDADGGEDDGEGDDEGAEAAGEDGGDAEERPLRDVKADGKRSASDTIRRLRKEAQDARRERDEARATRQVSPGPDRAEIDRLRREQEQAEQAELEAARLAGPEEVARVYATRTERNSRAQFQALTNNLAEREDRSEFRSLCREKPHMAKVAQEVEDNIARHRANGNYQITRENVAYWLLGKRADERSAGARDKQADRGKERVRRQTVRPRSGQSDVREDRRRGGDDAALERRMAKYDM